MHVCILFFHLLFLLFTSSWLLNFATTSSTETLAVPSLWNEIFASRFDCRWNANFHLGVVFDVTWNLKVCNRMQWNSSRVLSNSVSRVRFWLTRWPHCSRILDCFGDACQLSERSDFFEAIFYVLLTSHQVNTGKVSSFFSILIMASYVSKSCCVLSLLMHSNRYLSKCW